MSAINMNSPPNPAVVKETSELNMKLTVLAENLRKVATPDQTTRAQNNYKLTGDASSMYKSLCDQGLKDACEMSKLQKRLVELNEKTVAEQKAAEKKAPVWTTSEDPTKPGYVKKCYSIPDKKAITKARQASEFSSYSQGPTQQSGKSLPPPKILSRVQEKCPDPPEHYTEEDLLTVYPNGVAGDTLIPDDTTGRVDQGQLGAHVNKLITAGIIRNVPTMPVNMDIETNMDKYIEEDNDLYTALQTEYCFYNPRYLYALRHFLRLATSMDMDENKKAQDALDVARLLNIRVNSVLEVTNFITQQRIPRVNVNKKIIQRSNKEINDRIGKMSNSFRKIKNDNSIVITQQEMVRYTKEKNSYTSNQMALWAALNLCSIVSIFLVYRS